jgi:hypothetical protein
VVDLAAFTLVNEPDNRGWAEVTLVDEQEKGDCPPWRARQRGTVPFFLPGWFPRSKAIQIAGIVLAVAAMLMVGYLVVRHFLPGARKPPRPAGIHLHVVSRDNHG